MNTVFAEVNSVQDASFLNKGKFNASFSITYANSSDDVIIISNDQSASNLVLVPTNTSNENITTDTFVSSLNLSYGITSNTQISVNSSYLSTESSISGNNVNSIKSFSTFSLGFSREFYKHDGIHVSAFINTYIQKNDFIGGKKYEKGFSLGSFGTNISYESDPAILITTVSYTPKLSYEDIELGSSVNISGKMFLALNDALSVNAGVNYVRYNGTSSENLRGNSYNSLSPIFGINYNYGDKTTLYVNYEGSSSRSNFSMFGFGIVREF